MNIIATIGGLNAFREAQLGTSVTISYFKIGEGGWQILNGAQVMRTPDPNLSDLDCIENPSRYPSDSLVWYQKSITEADITHSEDGEITLACELDVGEGNDFNDIDPPEYWEIGVFTDEDVMMYYGTFSKFSKISDRVFHLDLAITIENVS